MSFFNKFNKTVDRFCFRHPGFGVRNLMLFIIIGNAAVYLFSLMDTTGSFLYYLYFSPALVLRGQLWRLITFVFVPEAPIPCSRPVFILLLFHRLGAGAQWGTGKFTLYYLSGMR
jgi:hypothetical protein